MRAFVFPGQGSQKRGMGERLFDEIREFADVEKEIDRLLGYSVRELCLSDPQGRLKETQYTQPALFVTNALHCYKARAEGVQAQVLAGHSLGEYNALHAAGAFDLVTGVRLVQKRGELMARARGGGMLAVIGLPAERVEAVLRINGLSRIDVANFNSPSQTVISGPLEEIRRAHPIYETAGAQMVVPLQVSAAFHSRYMAEAAREFESFLAPLELRPLQVPVIANVTATAYPQDAAGIKSLLTRQITHAVRWTDTVRNLIAQGISEFKEVGPGMVLTRLIQAIQTTPAAPARQPVRDQRAGLVTPGRATVV